VHVRHHQLQFLTKTSGDKARCGREWHRGSCAGTLHCTVRSAAAVTLNSYSLAVLLSIRHHSDKSEESYANTVL
jgi:hypothetical protein